MFRALRKLASLPFLWAGQLAGVFHLPVSVPLLDLAWAISRDGNFGRTALMGLYRQEGPEAAQAQAAAWMDQHPRPEIASWAGMLAAGAGDLDQARSYLARGREIGDDPAGMFELLELTIAFHRDDYQRLRQLTASLGARRDLAPSVRKLVLEQGLWQAMLDRQFDQARARAQYLLEVEDNQPADMALLALARRDRDPALIRRCLERTAALPARDKLYFQFLGSLAIGAADDARRSLAELRELDPAMARRAEQVITSYGGPAWA